MTGARIQIEVDDSQFREPLQRLGDGIGDLFPVLDDIGQAIEASTVQRFEIGAGPDGNPWPESLRAKLFGGKTLVDKGRLVDSISHQVAADRQSVEIGTNDERAAIHQFGGEIKPVNARKLHFFLADGTEVCASQVMMPARPFIGLDLDDIDEIQATILRWLADLGEASA